ncbi:MAG: tRNA uridine-5-carboxymethylaminomethyl(34) synthesis GTPase MnmE, partial [Oscillospiraceae bacterium]|nr:tRNA uridine-5-carboxymethylaminomethyl(34) synthesis GTPase MnmE [Oscillospiraceae bacterium]
MQQEDTIAAIATPPGVGGIGIVRLSGDKAIMIADRLFGAKNGKRLSAAEPFSALYGEITDAEGRTIDEALAIVMKAPRSYTREDVVELQCHGGTLVLRTVLERAFALGARPAERGEFTKRAFLNGRIDLSEAQAVMDIVGAKTEASLRVASGRLSGRFSARIKGCRDELLSMIAHLEA